MFVVYKTYTKLLTNNIDCKFIIKVEEAMNYLISIKCIILADQEIMRINIKIYLLKLKFL